jgi:hypothetical protein
VATAARIDQLERPPLIALPHQTSAATVREIPLTSEPPLGDLAPLTSEQPLAVEPHLTSEPSGRGGAGAAEA